MEKKHELRRRRHYRLRRRVNGTPERPRLAVFRSLKHIYAQVIDDTQGATLAAASTMDSTVKGSVKTGGDIEAAKTVGRLVAERAKEKGVSKVVFDRGGFTYHGRIASLADAAREAGLDF
jgi:large subunit ribosomal protein L18